MPSSKTKVEIAARSAALRSIPKELLDRFVTGPMSGTAVNAASMAALGDAGLAQPASSRCGAVRHPGSTPLCGAVAIKSRRFMMLPFQVGVHIRPLAPMSHADSPAPSPKRRTDLAPIRRSTQEMDRWIALLEHRAPESTTAMRDVGRDPERQEWVEMLSSRPQGAAVRLSTD
jgi:hypothetical protein